MAEKTSKQNKIILICVLVVIALLIIIGIVKAVNYRKNYYFNFDTASLQGEFQDLQTSTAEPVESVANE